MRRGHVPYINHLRETYRDAEGKCLSLECAKILADGIAALSGIQPALLRYEKWLDDWDAQEPARKDVTKIIGIVYRLDLQLTGDQAYTIAQALVDEGYRKVIQ